jgi:hypothetical protein
MFHLASIDRSLVSPENNLKDMTRGWLSHPFTSETHEINLSISLAENASDIVHATALLNRKYAERGYGDMHQIPIGGTYKTFVASIGSRVVGTATLNAACYGALAADDLFKDEINNFRRIPRAKVCELTRLAIELNAPSKRALGGLFSAISTFNRQNTKCTDLFIEVNPRHARFYCKLLGFKAIGDLKMNEKVGAPSQLMHIPTSNIASRITFAIASRITFAPNTGTNVTKSNGMSSPQYRTEMFH